MATPHEANLWQGYGDEYVDRGTLTASTVKTVDFGETVAAVLVEHLGTGSEDIYVTFDGTAPTADGTGDTNKRMYRLLKDRTISIDRACRTVKLITAGSSVNFQVVGLLAKRAS